MEQLRHFTISMGMAIYAHAIRSMQDEVAGKIDSIMPRLQQELGAGRNQSVQTESAYPFG